MSILELFKKFHFKYIATIFVFGFLFFGFLFFGFLGYIVKNGINKFVAIYK